MPRLSLLAASLALSLVAGEIAARMVLPRPGFVPFPVAETRGVMRRDAERGHVYAPDLVRHVVTPDYEIEFRTNSLGMRDVEPSEIDPDALPVLAVGDSYTQGHGVQADQAWPKRLQARLPGTHVFNAGVSGYGLHQMRRTAGSLLGVLRPRAIFVGLYGHGHSRVTDPYVVVGEDAGLVLRSASRDIGVLDDGFLVPAFRRPVLRAVALWIDRNWYMGGNLMHAIFGPRGLGGSPRPPRESPGSAVLEREMAPMLRELEGLRADAQRWDVPLVVLLVNPSEPEGGFSPLQVGYNEVIAAFARERGICCVDPLAHLERSAAQRSLRLGSDPHWSPLAHELAAAELVAVLERSLVSAGGGLPCQPAARRVLRR